MNASHLILKEDQRGVRRLGAGAGLGLAAAIALFVLPVTFLWLSTYEPGGFFTYGNALIDVISIALLAGALLFLVSLFEYRRAFLALRKVSPGFRVASILCLIGSIGFLLIVVVAAIVLGSASSMVSCLRGQPGHIYSCLKSTEPIGASVALIGFWLGWIGAVGIVAGLILSAGRYAQPALSGGGALYTILLLVLVGPFIFLFAPFEGAQYLLLVVPVLALLAPAFVLAGTVRITRTFGT
ncbi:MAG: hypothetical protein WA549_01770 [Thermoplasmata archaeon]